MNELIEKVASKVGISSEQASQAVTTVVGFIKDKLPDSIADQLDGFLDGEGGGTENLMDQAKDAIGGIFGGGDDD